MQLKKERAKDFEEYRNQIKSRVYLFSSHKSIEANRSIRKIRECKNLFLFYLAIVLDEFLRKSENKEYNKSDFDAAKEIDTPIDISTPHAQLVNIYKNLYLSR